MSTPERVLVVIEAVGKRQQLSTVLGLSADNIFATKGHIRRHPSWPHIGIRSNFDEFGLLYDVQVTEALRRVLARIEPLEVIVATDDDTEGDVIARDTVELTRRIWRRADDCEFSRARLRALDLESVNVAFTERVTYAAHGVLAGDVRRVVDRVIPVAFRSNVKGTVGRVRSAVITGASVGNVPTLVAHVVKRTDVGSLVALHSPVTEAQAKLIRAQCQGGPLRSSDSPPRLVNTMDVLLASAELGCEPKQAMGALQRLYERGLLSYPRTKSRNHSEPAKKFASLFTSAAKRPRTDGLGAEADGAHGPIVPLVNDNFVMQQPLNGANIGEGVYRWIARRSCAAYDGTPSLDPHCMDPLLQNLPWAAVHASTPSMTERCSFEPVSSSLQVLSILESLNIGRPSTYVQHAETVSQLGVFDGFGITEKGRLAQSCMPKAISGTELCIRVDCLQNEADGGHTNEVVSRVINTAFSEADVARIKAALSSAEESIEELQR